MTPPRERPPLVADERTQLMGWYDLQRAIIHLKCQGLSEVDAHRSLLPTSPLMTVAGVVSHLRIAAHSLDETGRYTDDPEGGATLRWMVLHMLEETARHAGHLDLIRELLDGQRGYF